jgi:hypothetical protein
MQQHCKNEVNEKEYNPFQIWEGYAAYMPVIGGRGCCGKLLKPLMLKVSHPLWGCCLFKLEMDN